MENTNCNSCDYCDYCKYCDHCDYCNYCNHCKYCKNLRMTEHNYFCWSEKYNDKDSFQQKRYRVFNVEVTEDEYNKIEKIYHELEFDKNESYATRFQTAFKKMWDRLKTEEKQGYFDIQNFNWEGFTFITGIEKESTEEMTLKQVCKELGRDIKITK